MHVTFSLLKKKQHEKTMFVPKCGFLNNFNGLANLPLPDKHALLVQKHVKTCDKHVKFQKPVTKRASYFSTTCHVSMSHETN